jgi:LDH2 family malate/lactate/ureidoglycolate dehydrogenase
LPFGQHKGYGLSLIDELLAAYTGGSLPTLRSRWNTGSADEKRTPVFYFQCMRPEAIDCGNFAQGRGQIQNVKAVIQDILGHGNDKSILPGQIEADAAKLSDKYGGLLFTAAEIDALSQIAAEANFKFDRAKLRTLEI